MTYDKTKLTRKQQQFINELASNPNITDYQAALNSGYSERVSRRACTIRRAVGKYLAAGKEDKKELAERLGLSKEKIIKGVIRLLEAKSESVVAKGLDLAMKFYGLYDPDKHEVISGTQEIAKLPQAELEAKAREVIEAMSLSGQITKLEARPEARPEIEPEPIQEPIQAPNIPSNEQAQLN